MISLFFIKTSPLIGLLTSSAADLPSTLSDKLTIIFPPSINSESVIESLGLHPQSNLVIEISCETSHNLLVK